MTNNYTGFKNISFLALTLVIGVIFAFTPSKAHAISFDPFNHPLDPLCLFSCSDPQPQNVSNTYTNSNNVNSYNSNSFNGSNVTANGSVYAATTPAPTVINNNNNSSVNGLTYNGNSGYSGVQYGGSVYHPTPIYQPAPVYNYPVYQQPTYYQQPVYVQPTPTIIYQQPQPTYYPQPTPVVYNNSYAYGYGNEIACYAGSSSATIGQSVTWSAGAPQPGYRYSWTGTDGLVGNQSTAYTTYSSTGVKSATVTVIYPNGQSQTKTCGTTVTVRSNYVAAAPAPTIQYVQVPAPVQDNSNLSASLISAQGISWGFFAILLILLLLAVIFYLILRKKE